MSALREIRQKTGLSQYEMASALQVSRSLIYLAEKGQRELPRPARMKLYEMTASVNNPDQMNPSLLEQPTRSAKRTADIETMITRNKADMDRCRLNAETLKSKMTLIQKKHEQMVSRLLLLRAVSGENTVKGFSDEGPDKDWITGMNVIANYELAKIDEWAQEKIKDEIELMEACEKIHRRHWKKWEGFKEEREV